MPEETQTKRRRRVGGAGNGASAQEGQQAPKELQEDVEASGEDFEPSESDDQESREEGADEQRSTLSSELRETIREAAIEVLKPVARKATTSAAKYAVTRGPDMVKDRVMPQVKDRVMPKVADAGGAGGLAGGLAKGALSKGGEITDKLPFGGKGKKDKKGRAPSGTGRGRRLPVQESIDVAVAVDVAYDQWTQFEDFPKFMHRVEKVEQRDDQTLMWHENIWGVRRSWEAEITEQIPGERIAWRSKEGPQVVGVVSFHEIGDRLTRIQMNVDFQPQGLFEKTASGTRITRRALKSDLMRFKAFIEMRDEATGQWRGRIEDGEPVGEGEDQEQDQDREEEEPQARGREEDEGGAEDEERDEDEEREEPRAGGKKQRRFSRQESDEDAEEEYEDTDEEAEEPTAEEDEYADEEPDEEEEEPAEEQPRPARRKTTASGGSAARRRR